MSKQSTSTRINTSRILGVFYSVRLKEAQTVFSFDLRSHHNARISILILIHISAYERSFKTRLSTLYTISQATTNFILERLLNAGLIKTVPAKRKTNIGKYVNLTAYMITADGMQTVHRINEMLDAKIAKLKQ